MSQDIILDECIGFIPSEGISVFFSPGSGFISPSASSTSSGTPAPVRKIINSLGVVPWGEDNRFPQNIEKLLAYSGIGKFALDWKARSYYGNRLFYGTITGYEDDGTEIFKIAAPGDFPQVDEFWRQNRMSRYFTEFLQDWVWFANCFPEVIFAREKPYITNIVVQEACDCRFKNMNDAGEIDTVYISKLWGMQQDQYVKFDPEKNLPGLTESGKIASVDNKYVKAVPCIDPYDPVASAMKIYSRFAKDKKLKSAILPVNYPSPNKTYYQLATWDGARLAGWFAMAAKIPALLNAIYDNGYNIKFHIEIPRDYFQHTYGAEKWENFSDEEKKNKRNDVLKKMKEVLSGTENAGKALITYFNTDKVSGKDYAQVKVNPIKQESNIDKELMTTATVTTEILGAMGLNPDMVGMGIPGGAYGGNKGGSNIREGKLVYDAMLTLERDLILEPLYFIRDFNQWPENLEFRFRDIKLTTLDKGKGTEKTLS
jgi:hypothetical protein